MEVRRQTYSVFVNEKAGMNTFSYKGRIYVACVIAPCDLSSRSCLCPSLGLSIL